MKSPYTAYPIDYNYTIELNTSFKIFLIGIIKILPIINSIQIQDIITRIFMFILSPQKNSSNYYYYPYVVLYVIIL